VVRGRFAELLHILVDVQVAASLAVVVNRLNNVVPAHAAWRTMADVLVASGRRALCETPALTVAGHNLEQLCRTVDAGQVGSGKDRVIRGIGIQVMLKLDCQLVSGCGSGLARTTLDTLVRAHLAWWLDVTLHHVADVRLALDVTNGDTTCTCSVLTAGRTGVRARLAINLGANRRRNCGQVGISRGYDCTTWVAEKLSLGVVRRTGDVFTAVRNHDNTALGVEEDGRGGHFSINQYLFSAMLLVSTEGTTLRPPPGARACRIVWATIRASEDDEKREDDENEQECLRACET